MDIARELSEKESRREGELLREQREQDKEETLMNATLAELRDPPTDHQRLMFPKSWLLRHKGCNNLLVQIIDQQKSETKKVLLKILKMEKNCKQWYNGDLPKYYFTFEIGKRLLAAHAKGDPKELETEMGRIHVELQEGTGLSKHQNDNGVPLIFEAAKKDYGPSDQTAGENTGDDDDDSIVVLDDDQVQQLRAGNAGGARPPLVVSAPPPVIEMN